MKDNDQTGGEEGAEPAESEPVVIVAQMRELIADELLDSKRMKWLRRWLADEIEATPAEARAHVAGPAQWNVPSVELFEKGRAAARLIACLLQMPGIGDADLEGFAGKLDSLTNASKGTRRVGMINELERLVDVARDARRRGPVHDVSDRVAAGIVAALDVRAVVADLHSYCDCAYGTDDWTPLDPAATRWAQQEWERFVDGNGNPGVFHMAAVLTVLKGALGTPQLAPPVGVGDLKKFRAVVARVAGDFKSAVVAEMTR